MTSQWLNATVQTIWLLLLLLCTPYKVIGALAPHQMPQGKIRLLSLATISTQFPPIKEAKSGELICPTDLATAIDGIVERPQLSRGRWGILIQSLSSAQTIYSRDAQKYFIPASNVKLLSTAATLHRLGSQFRIRTSIYGAADSSLHIVGRGDPSLSDDQLRELAQQLKRRKVRQVNQLIADDSYFRGPIINPSWEWEDVQADYGAPVSSFNLNQNSVVLTLLGQQLGQPVKVLWDDPREAVRWRIENSSQTVQSNVSTTSVSRELTGPVLRITGKLGVDSQPEKVAVAVVDPVGHFLRHFRRALLSIGIDGTTASHRKINFIHSNLHPSAFELAAVESPPLSQLLMETNQNSNNLYAEALLRTLGATSNTPTDSTAEAGLAVVKASLTELGVEPTGYVLVDASGLSRHNLVTPEAIAQTLRAMARSKDADVFRASLPVAGISGTLQSRFRNTPVQGILQAKTGTMSGIVALSGYLAPPSYEPLVFSIIVNQSEQSSTVLRQAIDEIVLLLSRLASCRSNE